MQGGTFSISNLGGIGGTGFTPIVNWPEVAILGVSRGRIEPQWHEGSFRPRLMMPLSLSYDHRLVDGADAARFLAKLKDCVGAAAAVGVGRVTRGNFEFRISDFEFSTHPPGAARRQSIAALREPIRSRWCTCHW